MAGWRCDPETGNWWTAVDGGELYVYDTVQRTSSGVGCVWLYGIELYERRRDGDWNTLLTVEKGEFRTMADAQFAAVRHYDRFRVGEQAWADEMTMIMAADPDDPDPDWWKT